MAEFSGRIGHLYGIESPFANAGGVIKTPEQLEELCKTQAGWAETGSFTPEFRIQQPVKRNGPYLHFKKSGESFNKCEMPNQGFSELMDQLPEMADIAEGYRKPLIINVAPTGDEPLKEVAEMVGQLSATRLVKAVMINTDCPSLQGESGEPRERISQNVATTREMLDDLRPITDKYNPIFMRVAPMDTLADMKQLMAVIRASRAVSAVFVSNSWGIVPGDVKAHPRLKGWKGGGKSGPAMAFRSANQTKWAVAELEGSGVDVVRSSGVATAEEVQRSLVIDAVAACGTTFFYESKNGWFEDTERLMSQLAA